MQKLTLCLLFVIAAVHSLVCTLATATPVSATTTSNYQPEAVSSSETLRRSVRHLGGAGFVGGGFGAIGGVSAPVYTAPVYAAPLVSVVPVVTTVPVISTISTVQAVPAYGYGGGTGLGYGGAGLGYGGGGLGYGGGGFTGGGIGFTKFHVKGFGIGGGGGLFG